MELIIDIDEDVRIAITRMGLLRIPDEMLKKVDKAIQHGKPLEEELHREKEQAYYLGYEDGRKSEWTAVAELKGKREAYNEIRLDLFNELEKDKEQE